MLLDGKMRQGRQSKHLDQIMAENNGEEFKNWLLSKGIRFETSVPYS
jgi:hypothetical protein